MAMANVVYTAGTYVVMDSAVTRILSMPLDKGTSGKRARFSVADVL